VKGLAFDANYTWSKGLTDVTEFNQEVAQGGYTADPTRIIRQIDYGVAENDLQNRFALSRNYQFAAGHTFTNGIDSLLGWHKEQIAEAIHMASVMGFCKRVADLFGLPVQNLLAQPPE
jgi:hypothetical protein